MWYTYFFKVSIIIIRGYYSFIERQFQSYTVKKLKRKEWFHMKRANESIRNEIHEAGLTQWQVAEAIGINATTLTVWLRTPLNSSRMSRINAALNSLQKGAAVNA